MKIICIGRNYANHAKELNNAVPSKPLVFMKPPSALLVNNKPFYYPDFSKDIHYELEVVLKICRNGRHVQPEFAHKYYDQIALGIDFTARDLQAQCKEKGHPWEIAKGFDNSAVLSNFVSIDLVNRNSIEFYLTKNEERVQHGNTKDLIFPFDHLIVYVSKFFKLQQGDIIYTGTPAGVGPIQIGDVLKGTLVTKDGDKELLNCEIR
ncbi:MAG: fumarylacetoacetate hydrolase family protein [Bacteroidota bacterium]